MKRIEVSKDDVFESKVNAAIEKKAETTKEYTFKRTYIGMLGAFHKGKTYSLTEEQYNRLRGDIE
jgi:hypothetical protein